MKKRDKSHGLAILQTVKIFACKNLMKLESEAYATFSRARKSARPDLEREQ